MATIHIRPKKGMRLRDMAGGIVPPYGAPVEISSYWTRKLQDQDAEKISEAEFARAKKAHEKRLLDEQAKDNTPPAGA